VLILPTGTGKTRVAVTLLIEDFKKTYEKIGTIRHNVLWIAHTKELCEQAIEKLNDALTRGCKLRSHFVVESGRPCTKGSGKGVPAEQHDDGHPAIPAGG